jgi:hypothetical protein
MQLFERRMREAGADVADVAPFVTLADGKHQRTEVGPRSAWRGEAGDHRLLAARRLDLQPVRAACTRVIAAVSPLGHDAFEALLLGLLEVLNAVLRAVLAERQQRMTGQDAAQAILALEQTETTQILSLAKHHIEDAVEQLGFGPKGILQQLEAGDTMRIERHQFAIDHGIRFHLLQGLCNAQITVANDLAIAGESVTFPRSIVATMRKPSHLDSKIQAGSSNGASVSVASMGCSRLGSLETRGMVTAWQNALAKLALKRRAACSFGAPRAGVCLPTS